MAAVIGGTISEVTGGKFANGAAYAAFAAIVSGTAQSIAEETRNQSSIDRINGLSDSLEERQAIFDEGLEGAKAQNLNVDEVKITAKLGEIRIGARDGQGGYDYQSFTSKSEALAYLGANPSSFAADGVYHGGGNISIYATATSSGTRLFAPQGGLLDIRQSSGLFFNRRLTGVENVVQTIAHETGHYRGLGHTGTAIYNREYSAIRDFRRGR